MLTSQQIAYVVGVLWDAGVDRPDKWSKSYGEWSYCVSSTDYTDDWASPADLRNDDLDAILYRIEGWLMRKAWLLMQAPGGIWYFQWCSREQCQDPNRTTAILRAAWLQLEAEGKITEGKEWPV